MGNEKEKKRIQEIQASFESPNQNSSNKQSSSSMQDGGNTLNNRKTSSIGRIQKMTEALQSNMQQGDVYNPTHLPGYSKVISQVDMDLLPPTKEFLRMLQSYLDCRSKMDAKDLEVDEFRRIASYDVTPESNGIEIGNNVYKQAYQQQSVLGEPVQSLAELYEAAEVGSVQFELLMLKLVQETNAKFQNDEDDKMNHISFTAVPLKGKPRAREKASDDYGSRKPRPGVSWLYDIVRGSIECRSADQILWCLRQIQVHPGIHIVNVKNRFQKPSLSGYRDVNLHVRITCSFDGASFQHVCEIQIHHASIKALDKQLHSHDYYEYFRTYFAGSTGTLKSRLEDLKLIGGHGGPFDEAFFDELLEKSLEEERLERLAILFWNQLCEYGWALRVYRRLLEIRLQNHNVWHSSIAKTYFKIASLLKASGCNEDALALYRKALELYRRIFGDKELSAAHMYNEIGNILQYEESKVEEAVDLYERAIEIKKIRLGETHSQVAELYINLATATHRQGDSEGSMKLYQLANSILGNPVPLDSPEKEEEKQKEEENIDELHPSIAIIYHNVGLVYQDMGEYASAQRMFDLSTEVFKRHVGKDHLSIAHVQHAIARMLSRSLNQHKPALEMYQTSLNIQLRNLRPRHVFVVCTLQDIAHQLYLDDKLQEAQDMYQRSIAPLDGLRERIYGELLLIAKGYNNIAVILEQTSGEQSSLAFYEQALNLCIDTEYSGKLKGLLKTVVHNIFYLLQASGKIETIEHFAEQYQSEHIPQEEICNILEATAPLPLPQLVWDNDELYPRPIFCGSSREMSMRTGKNRS